MIQEIAMLDVKEEKLEAFEGDFMKASKYISSIEGYIKHSLSKCLESENRYFLYVEWETLENHVVGFRESKEYLAWKRILHHYYEPFPVVEHYKLVYKS